MSNNQNTSKEIRALDVLNLMSQTRYSSTEFFTSDIQNLIDSLRTKILYHEIVSLIFKLGEQLYEDKILNVSSDSDFFEVGLDFLETHIKYIGNNIK